MGDEKSVSYEFQFKGKDYIVSMYLSDEDGEDEKLFLELEEKDTAETWKGVYEAACK